MLFYFTHDRFYFLHFFFLFRYYLGITNISYYTRFIGSFYITHDDSFPTFGWCDPNEDCLNVYHAWSTNVTTDVINNLFRVQYGRDEVLGAQKFGRYHIVQKIHNNVPKHTQVKIKFDLLKTKSWENEKFIFKAGGVIS